MMVEDLDLVEESKVWRVGSSRHLFVLSALSVDILLHPGEYPDLASQRGDSI